MGKYVSKLGPVTGYWILILIAIGMAKLMNWVDLNDTMAAIKYLAFVTLGYIVLNAAYAGYNSFKK